MTTDSSRESLPMPISLAVQRLLPLPKDPYLLEGFDPRRKPLATTLLPPALTLVPAKLEQSPPCPAPPAPTQRPAPHASTLKTIKITLKTSPPALTIRPDTLLHPASTSSCQKGGRPCSSLPPQLVPAKVEQSTPCSAPPALTQRPAPHASTLHTPNQPHIPILFPTTHPSTSPRLGPTENFRGNPHLMPQFPFHSIFQPPARIYHRVGVCE